MVLRVLGTVVLIESLQVCWIGSLTGRQHRWMAGFVISGLEGNTGLSAATEKMPGLRTVSAKTM